MSYKDEIYLKRQQSDNHGMTTINEHCCPRGLRVMILIQNLRPHSPPRASHQSIRRTSIPHYSNLVHNLILIRHYPHNQPSTMDLT